MGSRARKGGRKRRNVAWWQMVVIAIIIAAFVSSVGLNVIKPGGQPNLPERLGTLELVGAVEGEEAMSRIEDLHGIGFELTSAYIAEYVHGSERGSVWVGRTGSSATAEALTQRMRAAIEEGSSTFSDVRQIQVAGTLVYRVDGPGGDHFFYHSERHGKQVIWLTVSVAYPLDVLEDTVRYY